MNLERILAENLLRFGGKNLNKQLFVYKYLLEQSDKQAAAIELLKAQGDAYNQFVKWQNMVSTDYKNVILTKSQEFVPFNPEPIVLEDAFYNNFVTLEKGVKNSKALKTALDGMITKLKEQGVKLNVGNGKTMIEIVSTATPPAASTGPRAKDFPGGTVPATHKKLDHDYGGNLKYDAAGKPTPESIEWAKTNGNEYLARARGESVKTYLQEKGVMAIITVVPLINQEKRQFQITAKQEGTQKVITPIGTPDLQWEVYYSAGIGVAKDQEFLKDTVEWKNIIDNAYNELSREAQRDYMEGGGRLKRPDATKFPDKNSAEYRTEYYRLNLGLKGGMLQMALYGMPAGTIYLSVGGGWTFGNSQGQLPGVNAKISSVIGANNLQGIVKAIANAQGTDLGKMSEPGTTKSDIEANYRGMKKEMFQTWIPAFGVDVSSGEGSVEQQGMKGISGINEAGRLNTTGYTRNGNLIYKQFQNAASPLFTQLTGTDVAAWLKSVNDLALSDAIYSKIGNGSFYYEQFKTDLEPLTSMTVSATGKGDLKALIKAAVAAGISDTSETISTDPKYWVNAYYIDYTNLDAYRKPARGKLTGQDAIDFFQDTKFAQ
jgi:hypothetical protein